MNDPLGSARDLLDLARELYRAVPEVATTLDELHERLDQPLRVALVGSVKAGKSTLLNGLLGERIAPTDSRECTRILTWYHYGSIPSVRGHLTDDSTIAVPTRRQDDRLELDLEGLTPEEFNRLDVTWPAPGVKDITLIDTPGIASISQDVASQTDQFLLPEQGAAGADAVIYLLRSLHESDIRFLHSLNEHTRHGNSAIGAIAVLSRADEIASGRLTAMLSINEAVDKLRQHPRLEGLCETVVPVAGLLGVGATTLRQADFTVLKKLSLLDSEQTRTWLLSAERFITAKDQQLPSERTRIDLVDRFGIYGIRLALAVLRGGIDDADDLATELLRRSGLEELRRVIDVHFTQRQAELKAHSITYALHKLLRNHPRPGSTELLVKADEHMSATHTFVEMQLVGRIASGQLQLSAEQVLELERLIGGRGSSAQMRLGFYDSDATDEELLRAGVEHLARWRKLSENPLLDHKTHTACRVAEKSCEAVIARLMEKLELTTAEWK